MRYFILFMLFLTPLLASSQNVQEDVLHLKNGEIYRGKIMKTNDTSTVRLKTRAANELLFKKKNIKKIRHQQVNESVYQARANDSKDEENFKKKGYSLLMDMGVLFGKGAGEDISAGLNAEIINSYVFNPHFSAGVGVASQLYQDYPYLPVFANVRGNLSKSNSTPYATASFGWNTPWLIIKKNYPAISEFDGGRFFQAGLGVRMAFSSQAAFFLEMGFSSNRMKVTGEDAPYYLPPQDFVNEKVIYTKNRLTFKFGFRF